MSSHRGSPAPRGLGLSRVVLLIAAMIVLATPAAGGPPCLGDFDGNGAVDVNDLLDLLSTWGPYEPCPPVAPADFNGDCEVGVQDLLDLLSFWGPCEPPPFGACCLPDGGCIDTFEHDCDAIGGVYLGVGTFCGPGACGAGVVGACCLPNGACIEVDVPACAANGGQYQGVGIECSPDVCDPP
ncbi:MAG: hypothetical protein ACYTGG_04360 [Planctomycetota bacterium]|jgi:hypothetical protein